LDFKSSKPKSPGRSFWRQFLESGGAAMRLHTEGGTLCGARREHSIGSDKQRK
jgi:hypothetical protein